MRVKHRSTFAQIIIIYRLDNGSTGNEATILNGSWFTAGEPLNHDKILYISSELQYYTYSKKLISSLCRCSLAWCQWRRNLRCNSYVPRPREDPLSCPIYRQAHHDIFKYTATTVIPCNIGSHMIRVITSTITTSKLHCYTLKSAHKCPTMKGKDSTQVLNLSLTRRIQCDNFSN